MSIRYACLRSCISGTTPVLTHTSEVREQKRFRCPLFPPAELAVPVLARRDGLLFSSDGRDRDVLDAHRPRWPRGEQQHSV